MAVFEHGDHAIVLGEVRDADVGNGPALLYHRRGYRELDAVGSVASFAGPRHE